MLRGIFRCGHCGEIGDFNSGRIPNRERPPTSVCRNPNCRGVQSGVFQKETNRSPRVRVGRPDSSNPCLALYLPHEGFKRDAARLRLHKIAAGKDPLLEADYYRAVNPRWICGDPVPRPITRAMNWGVN